MKRYTRLPLALYRIQSRLPVALRDYDSQIAKGRTSFDLKLDGKGFVQPMVGSKYITTNGMSLRPAGDNMLRILKSFPGEPTIYYLQGGMKLPPEFVVYHEHTDHYSLQAAQPILLQTFNKQLTEFLEMLPSQTKERCIDQLEDVDDQNN